jgi:hypothetical protein
MVLKVSTSILLYQHSICCSVEPQDIGHALCNLSWVNAIHEELENFERNHVWALVEPPRDVNVI